MGIRLKKISHNISVNQLSITEQSQMCVRNTHPAMLEQEDLFLVGQSDPLFVPGVMKTHTPLTDDPAQEDLLQKYEERVDKLSQQNRVIKFCTDAGFLTTVDVGQYFMTKDTEEFSQFTESVACREYTLPRAEDSSEPKGWIRGNTKIGPVLEVTTSYLQGKHGVEIWIESVNKDNSHSWVIISHGLKKLVTNLNNKDEDDNEQETSEIQVGEDALKLNAGDFASRSKAKAKPQRRDSVSSSTRTKLIGERTWTDVEPGKYSLSDYSVWKKLIRLLRHGSLPRDNDGAIEFWRIKDNLQNHVVFCHHWSDEKWKMTRGGGNKKRFQHCADFFRNILYLRAFQGDSARNLIHPSLQDNALIPNDFFKYIYHVGCSINLHSIISSGLIPGGQILSKRQTVVFLPAEPMDKERKDPDTIDLEAPRLAQHMHKPWKKHQSTVYWVDINLALKKGLKFYQKRSNAITLHETLPAYCIPKVVRMETGEVIYEKVFASPRPPPRISLAHDWMKEMGSEVARQPEGEVAREAKSSQPTPLNPNPNHDRTGRPVVCSESVRSSSVFNDVDMDFRISGLPHSVVKQADNYRDRELVKKIENHLIDKLFTRSTTR